MPASCPQAVIPGRVTLPSQACTSGTLLSVAVVVELVRALDRHADIICLVLLERGELGADLAEMEPRHLLVELLRQGIDLLLVLAGIGPQLDLRQRLVGEGGAHHEARMTHSVAEIDEPA